jgi:glycosyltransferase involved in cell wall biosynthesis
VGADTPAVRTVIEHGVDGWLVPFGDSSALAQAIGHWIDAPHLAQEMGERGRSKVLSRFTVSRVADVAEGIYLRTLRSRERSRGMHN